MIEWLIAQYKLEVNAKIEVSLYVPSCITGVRNKSLFTQVDSVHVQCAACASGLL